MGVNHWFIGLMIAFILVGVAMVLIILMQRPHGGGLAAAFGGAGAGGGDSVFGGRVGDALTWATIIAFVLFLGLALGLNVVSPSASIPRGACCLPDGTCEELTESVCLSSNGTWQGAGSDCATAGCPPAEDSAEAILPEDGGEAPVDTGAGEPAGTEPADEAPAGEPEAPGEEPDNTEPPAGGSGE